MNKRTAQNSIAILIPAHNEEVVLSKTIKSALQVVNKKDLYIVNDGSTDKTAKIAKSFTRNILSLKKAQGKANALNMAISHFKLPKRYKFIFPVDADTTISPDFLDKTLKVLIEDKEEKYICVIGKVTGISNNWLTSYRMWEYEIAQLIHKNAQQKQGSVLVSPGCATVYRSKLFTQIQIPSDTIVEDMDLTFLIHRKKLGKIAFAPWARVYTQDPYSLKDYIKQIRRWYGGYWQCIKKHSVPWGKQAVDLEASLLTIEALAGGLLTILLIFSLPFILFKQPGFFMMPFLVDFFIFLFPTVFLTMFIHSNLKIIKYLPGFYFVRYLNSLVFLYSFFESLFTPNTKTWNQVSRYSNQGVN